MGKRWVFVLLCSAQLLFTPLSVAEFSEEHSHRPHHKRVSSRRTKVLILGAGVAGITAAKTLQEHGLEDFLILEAQDYIGGRFKQRSFAGVNLEEGANWIHYADEKKNPLWELKNMYNLRGIFTNYSDVIIRYMSVKNLCFEKIEFVRI